MKDKIINKLNQLKQYQSNINEHLPTLERYSKECNHVTEFGVGTVVSTWAWLIYPKTIRSYDLNFHANLSEVKICCKEYNVDFIFIKVDTLKVEIEPTDLLFIDTLHCYRQLIEELRIHANKVKKYLIFHDTTLYEFLDEPGYFVYTKEDKQGLKTAYLDFLQTEEGSNWELAEEFINNNGV